MSRLAMRHIDRLAAALAFVCVQGCSVGPDFVPPVAITEDGWYATGVESDVPSRFVQNTPDTIRWWESFHDPLLTELITQAFAANLDLKQAEARVQQARAVRLGAWAGELPVFGASGTYRRSSGSSRGVSSSGVVVDPISASTSSLRNLYDAGFDASWEIDIFGGQRRAIEVAGAQLQAASEDRNDVLISAIAEIALNYCELRAAQEQERITRENLGSQRGTADLTEKRFSAGFVSALDVANANSQVATTLAQLPTYQAQASKSLFALSALLGLPPDALAEKLAAPQPIPTVPPLVSVGLPSELLRRRPDIRRAEAQLHAATARIGVAIADLFPRFSLTGFLGWQGSTWGSLTRWSSPSWFVQPGAALSVFNGQQWASVFAQNAAQQEAFYFYQETVVNALRDAEGALVDYSREQERRAALQSAVNENGKAVEIAKRLYQEGAVDFLNVLSAQRSLYTSQDSLVQSSKLLSQNLVRLYKVLGGGWEPE